MLTKYKFTLQSDKNGIPRPEWGYRLYAALLEQAPENFGTLVHQDGVTPISQFLSCGKEELVWTVSLLGENCESVMVPVLERRKEFFLSRDAIRLTVTGVERQQVCDVDGLFAQAKRSRGVHRVQFCTPTAFKSQGVYLNLPTTRLILQNLIKKWNGCILECPIQDEDGQGMETLAAGLHSTAFRLQSRDYYLKGQKIPGFMGSMTLEHHMKGFHGELTDALLLFADYAGIGIKTTLGMGGVEHNG